MGYLLTDSGFSPPNVILTDNTGTTYLTDSLPSGGSITYRYSTFMMSLLLAFMLVCTI
jgi:hypothetical protein